MLRVLVPCLLLLAVALPAPASAAPDLCNKYGTCPILVVGDDHACAGWAFGTQGVATCADAGDGCVHFIAGFNRDSVCALGLVLP